MIGSTHNFTFTFDQLEGSLMPLPERLELLNESIYH